MLQTSYQFLKQGFIHVLPLGFDHILFITSLFFLNSNLQSVIIQCTVFTVAHTITLFLSVYQIILPNSNVIEPIIALSIVFTSIENIFRNDIGKRRIFIIFCFGLVHGMGFATALQELGVPKKHFLGSLLSFNIGVEIAQIFILLMLYYGFAYWLKNKIWYQQKCVYPISCIIACIAFYWAIERILA